MTLAKFVLLILLSAGGAFLAVGFTAALAAILPHAGYELTETGAVVLRCALVGAMIGWGPRYFMRRLGIRT